MSIPTLHFSIRDERGVALPLAVIVLAVVASLTLAFIALSATEPQITANLVASDQALALAEAGLEQAMWALSNPGPSGLVFPGTIPPPYAGGNTPVGLGNANTGVYTIAVALAADGVSPEVTATGLVPNAASPQAKRIVKATFAAGAGDPRSLPNNLPAAFTAKGTLELQDNAKVDARPSAGSTCGSKIGTYSLGATTRTGAGTTIYGDDGNSTANQQPGDYKQNQSAPGSDPVFAAATLTPAQVATLKAAAQANGSYYNGPQDFGTPGGSCAACKVLKNGIVFVDTVSGNPIGSPPNAADFGKATLHTGVDASGWLIVMGDIYMNGPTDLKYKGLLYAMNRLELDENFRLDGAAVALGVKDTNMLLEDTTVINFDCNAINNGLSAGTSPVPSTWAPKPGTWREQPG